MKLAFAHGNAQRAVSFGNFSGPAEEWREQCRAKLTELLAFEAPSPGQARELRSTELGGVRIRALVMEVSPALSLPAYLLEPAQGERRGAVLAIHGHGAISPAIGFHDDYHHRFALELARAGYVVLCPELRGFGALRNLSLHREGYWLDYWATERGRQFTLVTEGFLYGKTLVGQTVADLLRWEEWFCRAQRFDGLDVAGFSYGGDLALTHGALSGRVRRIFAGSALGSYALIYSRSYNAPAHCIPGVLRWMDRSDIAGLNAPRPIALQYGDRDTPGPNNSAAAVNESLEPSVAELRAIYRAFGAEDAVRYVMTPNLGHEIDVKSLLTFLAG
ncbi:MAG: hypothetical protein KIT09_03540 [Bryobacteraceae bacterium]|nr:hypothetical protein [Bryobacteraceae bacterium]